MNLRTSSRTSALIAASVWLFALPALTQTLRITSFSHNGVLICSDLAPGTLATVESSSLTNQWQDLQSVTVEANGTIQVTVPMAHTAPTFFRVRGTNAPPANMVLIPAGSFEMGDSLDENISALPVHSVYISAFCIDRYEVTTAQWLEVYYWATNHGYRYLSYGMGKAENHPVHSIPWFDAVKWCNARSEKEGRTPAYYTDEALSIPYRTKSVQPYVNWTTGYRLPTEAEWEKAARGGVSGRRFPWSDTDNITHLRANYYVYQTGGGTNHYAYDVSPTPFYHPTFYVGDRPYTSPVGYFAPNDYGLYDMAGNVEEWCWDRYSETYYSSSPSADPKGPASGSYRVIRSSWWNSFAKYCSVAARNKDMPSGPSTARGFRTVLPAGQ